MPPRRSLLLDGAMGTITGIPITGITATIIMGIDVTVATKFESACRCLAYLMNRQDRIHASRSIPFCIQRDVEKSGGLQLCRDRVQHSECKGTIQMVTCDLNARQLAMMSNSYLGKSEFM